MYVPAFHGPIVRSASEDARGREPARRSVLSARLLLRVGDKLLDTVSPSLVSLSVHHVTDSTKRNRTYKFSSSLHTAHIPR
jgi:hypothetical protein